MPLAQTADVLLDDAQVGSLERAFTRRRLGVHGDEESDPAQRRIQIGGLHEDQAPVVLAARLSHEANTDAASIRLATDRVILIVKQLREGGLS